jgi:hypothetical protein
VGEDQDRPTEVSHRFLLAVLNGLPELYTPCSTEALRLRLTSLASQLVDCEITTYDEWEMNADGTVGAYRVLRNPASFQLDAALLAIAHARAPALSA